MVPIPVWERPEVKTFNPEDKTDAPVPEPEQSASTNVSGRWWKAEKKPTVRAQAGKKNKAQLDKAWKAREDRRKRDEAVKKIEKYVAAPPFVCPCGAHKLIRLFLRCTGRSRTTRRPRRNGRSRSRRSAASARRRRSGWRRWRHGCVPLYSTV